MSETTQIGTIKIDTAQAQKAIDDLTKSLNNLNTKFQETEKKVSTPLWDKATKGAKEAGVGFGHLAGAIGIATTAADLAVQAFEKLVEIVKEGFKAWQDEEKFIKKVSVAYNENAFLTDRIVRLRDKFNKNPLFTKEEITNAVTFGVEMGRTEQQISKMMEAAQGLSQATGVDLQTAMVQLNQTLEGQKGRLARYVGEIKNMTTEQLKNGEAIDAVAKRLGKFGDQGSEVQIKINRLRKDWNEFIEKEMSKSGGVISGIVDWFTHWFEVVEKTWKGLEHLAGNIADLIKKIPGLATVINAVGKAFQWWSEMLPNIIQWLDKITTSDEKKRAEESLKIHNKLLEDRKKQQDAYLAADKKQQAQMRKNYTDAIAALTKEDVVKNASLIAAHKDMLEKFDELDAQHGQTSAGPDDKAKEKATKKIEEQTKNAQETLKIAQETADKIYEIEVQKYDEIEKLSFDDYTKLLKLNTDMYKARVDSAKKQKELLVNANKEYKKINGVDSPDYINQIKALDVKLLDYRIQYNKRRIELEKKESKDELEVRKQQLNDRIKILEQETTGEEDYLKATEEQMKKSSLIKIALLYDEAKKRHDILVQQLKDEKELAVNVETDPEEKVKIAEKYDKVIQKSELDFKSFNHTVTTTMDENKKKTEEFYNSLASGLQGAFGGVRDDFVKLMDDIKNGTGDITQDVEKLALDFAKVMESQIFSNISKNIQKTLQETLDSIDQETTKSQNDLDKLLKFRIITEAEYQKRKDKLDAEKAAKEKAAKKEAAQKQREADVIQAVINGIQATLLGLAQGGPVLAAVDAALAAIQIGLLLAEPLPSFRKGGVVPKKYASGGMITGPSHDMGGVPLIAEGGEQIFSKEKTQQFQPWFKAIQNNQINPSQPMIAQVDNAAIANAVTNSIRRIPVSVSEYDITKTQKKVSTIQSNATW